MVILAEMAPGLGSKVSRQDLRTWFRAQLRHCNHFATLVIRFHDLDVLEGRFGRWKVGILNTTQGCEDEGKMISVVLKMENNTLHS